MVPNFVLFERTEYNTFARCLRYALARTDQYLSRAHKHEEQQLTGLKALSILRVKLKSDFNFTPIGAFPVFHKFVSARMDLLRHV